MYAVIVTHEVDDLSLPNRANMFKLETDARAFAAKYCSDGVNGHTYIAKIDEEYVFEPKVKQVK